MEAKRRSSSNVGRDHLPVNSLDLAVMLYSVQTASEQPQIGFLDANQTMDQFVMRLSREVIVPKELVESALAHCNFLNEDGKFKDPRGFTFDQYLGRLEIKFGKFNREYNWFEGDEK